MWVIGVNRGETSTQHTPTNSTELVSVYNPETGESKKVSVSEICEKRHEFSGCEFVSDSMLIFYNQPVFDLYKGRIKIKGGKFLIEDKPYMLVSHSDSGISLHLYQCTGEEAYIGISTMLGDIYVELISLGFYWCEMLSDDTMLIILGITTTLSDGEDEITKVKFYVRVIITPGKVRINSIVMDKSDADSFAYHYECSVPDDYKTDGALGARLSLLGY